MWPGYEISTKSLVHGIFLNVDTATKFVNKETILETIDYLMGERRYSKADIIDMYKPNNQDKRVVVMTSYNSKTYQLDGIDFDRTPKNTVF